MDTSAPQTRYEVITSRLPGDRALRLRSRSRPPTIFSQVASQIRSRLGGEPRAKRRLFGLLSHH